MQLNWTSKEAQWTFGLQMSPLAPGDNNSDDNNSLRPIQLRQTVLMVRPLKALTFAPPPIASSFPSERAVPKIADSSSLPLEWN